MNNFFNQLLDNVRRMTQEWPDIDLNPLGEQELFTIELGTVTGVEISLEQLENHDGLLTVNGTQVILFIPDHTHTFVQTLEDPVYGNRIHIAECRTLARMRAEGRLERYMVTNNMDGRYRIHGLDDQGVRQEAETELHVCKNCLHTLNYKGFRGLENAIEREDAVRSFEERVFFLTYSSMFNELPNQAFHNRPYGYTEDWPQISLQVRSEANFTCEECGVNLSNEPKLLHTHHLNGMCNDNRRHNLQALCADCHRKAHKSMMYVPHNDMVQITRRRIQQGIIPAGRARNYTQLLRVADPCLHGVIEISMLRDWVLPVLGHRVNTPPPGIVTLELAWPDEKEGVLLNSIDVPGWSIMTPHECIEYLS